MSESKSNKNPTYALGTLLWVKLLKRVWWPGTVVDPLTIPQELKEYVKKVEPISCVVKFKEEDDKYHVVELNEEVYLYSCDRKIEFIEKGLSLYENQMKGLAVVGNFDMEFFEKEVISIEKLIGGDECIFKNLKEEKEKFKSIVKELFTPTNTRKSKKKEVERKSLPAPKLPKTPKTPNQPKPKPVSKPRTSTQSQVGKTYPTSTDYSCYSEAGCNFTTNRYENLKRHVASYKKDKDEVTTSKLSNSSTPNKRKNLKTKPSVVKKQKLQEDLLKDWDNDGEDEDEEINTSGVQSSIEEVLQAIFGVKSFGNVVQSSNEEVLQTIIDLQSSGYVVQSSNEEIVQTMTDLLSTKNLKTKPSVVKKQKLQEELLKDWDNDSEDEDEEINTSGVQSSIEEVLQAIFGVKSFGNVVQSSNEEVLQTIIGVQSSGHVVQSSNEEIVQTMTDLLSTKNLKTKPSVVKKQKLQEELLKDWDNDGVDEDEEINTSGVQSSIEEVLQAIFGLKSFGNVVQSSNEEVLQTIIDLQSCGYVVQSSNEEIVQTMTDLLSTKNLKTKPSVVKKQKLQEELLKDWDNDSEDEDEEINTSGVQSSIEEVLQAIFGVQSFGNVVQSSNEEVLQTIIGVQSSGHVVQSSNEEIVQTMTDLLSTKNLKTKPSVVKKQKLQEELLKDWDNDGVDEDEEINTSGVQSSIEEVLQAIFGVQSFGNVVQSSNEEVLQTIIDLQSSGYVVQSSNEEIVQTMTDLLSTKNLKTKPSVVKKQKLQEELLKDWDNDGEDEDEEINTSGVQSSSNFAQFSNEEVLQAIFGVQSFGNVVQSSNEEVIPTSKVLSNKNDTLPIISKDISRNKEVQETSTCSPNKVFDFNENDNNTPVVELRQSKSDCSSTVDNDISQSGTMLEATN